MFGKKPGFLRKNLEWILFFFLITIILSIILSIIIYKSFCTINQIIDWEVVSAISEIFMGLFTIVAIFIAIYIPQKDRITSSKIELFTQRFELYLFIVNRFTQAFNEGKTQYDDIELLNLGYKSFFIISREDDKELTKVLGKINEKISQKFQDKSNPDPSLSITDEIKDIDSIFDKYLNLREYGVEHKNFFNK